MRLPAFALVAALLAAAPIDAQMHHQGQGSAQPPSGGMMGHHAMPAPQMGSMPMTGMGMMEMDGMGMMGPMGDLRGFDPGRLIEQRELLELTDDQVARLTALQQKADSAASQAHEPAHAAMLALEQELASDAPDANAVHRLLDAHRTAMGNVQWARVEAALDARKLLTPEQYGMVKGMQIRSGMPMRTQHGPPSDAR